MFIIYRFYSSYLDSITKQTILNVWEITSQHSQLIDAEAQLQRFIDSGVSVNYLRLLTDQDPIPTDIPTP